MKRKLTKLLALGTALAVYLSMVTVALAGNKSDHVTINKPTGTIYYIGEKIPVAALLQKYEVENPGDCPSVSNFMLGLCKQTEMKKEPWQRKTVWVKELDNAKDAGEEKDSLFPDGKTRNYTASINTAKMKKLAPGKYTFFVWFCGIVACRDEEAAIEEGWYELTIPRNEEPAVNLTLKKLGKPSGLKMKAGKKKVTVSWKKAAGAKKYEVYRSTKKSKGYAKVATTAKLKITDKKKLKKGRKYYYKVRTVRTGNGTVRSGFTSPKRSGKVK